MPMVTVNKADVTVEETVAALKEQLGSRYDVETHGTHDRIRVGTSALAFANVHMTHEDGGTQFHVHGGGLIIGRVINEFSTARAVAAALRRAPGFAAAG